MSERPGQDESGYPPAPAPRPEPYSVDDGARGGGELEAGGTEPEHDWRPTPTRTDDHVPPAPPWQVPTRDTTPAGGGGETSGRSGQSESPDRGPDAAREPVPSGAGGPGAGGPGAGGPGAAAPEQGPSHPQAAYPPAAPPPEFVPSVAAAASSADTRFAWHSPAAQPWQQPVSEGSAGGAAHGRPHRRRGVGGGVVVLLVLVALLGGLVLGALGARWLWPAGTSGALPQSTGTTTSTTARAPESVAGIAQVALESTVYIEVLGTGAASSGSGMVLREDGYVVTNNHVIAPVAGGNGRVDVTFADGSKERAEIVGRTADYDLAVLKVARTDLVPLRLADSDAVVVGDPAIAVGAPLGLEGTVTSGIVSALNRPVEAGRPGDTTSFINAIQTDAAINPGNSGGPLLNLDGEVIAINTAIAQAAGQQTGSIGLGFAIPANQVRRTAEQIIETGRATYPVIGVALDMRYSGEGVQVLTEDAGENAAVTPGGPGDDAGIAPGDVITHFDGQPVTKPSELIVAVRARAPGDTVVLTVRSGGGEERQVEVVLDENVSG